MVYRADAPVRLRQATDSVANACLLFLDVALDREFRLRDVQLEFEDEWVPAISPRLWQAPELINPDTLMPPETITVERLATFIDLHNRLDALTDPIAHPLEKGAIQARLLVNSSVVEGVHRRLWPERKRFALQPNTSIKTVRRAAKDAGVDSFVSQGITDSATAEKCLNDALQHLNEISFTDRVRDIAEEVGTALPEVFESIPNYADRLVGARNELAHHLLTDEEKGETLTEKIDRWAALDYATPWAMRALILLRSGVTPWEIACSFLGDEILPSDAEHRYAGYQRFQLCRENIRQIARELGWLE